MQGGRQSARLSQGGSVPACPLSVPSQKSAACLYKMPFLSPPETAGSCNANCGSSENTSFSLLRPGLSSSQRTTTAQITRLIPESCSSHCHKLKFRTKSSQTDLDLKERWFEMGQTNAIQHVHSEPTLSTGQFKTKLYLSGKR